MTPSEIIKYLRVLSKTELHEDVAKFIMTKARSAGQLYKVLENGQYYIETTTKHRGLLKRLRKHLQNQALNKGAEVDVLQSHTRVIEECNEWLDLFYEKNEDTHTTGHYGDYPWERLILKATESTGSSINVAISGALQLNTVEGLSRGDSVVYQRKSDKDQVIDDMIPDQVYRIKDVHTDTNTITLVVLTHKGKIDNQTPIVLIQSNVYQNELRHSKFYLYDSTNKMDKGTLGYNAVRAKMNKDKWQTQWRAMHKRKLLQIYKFSEVQSDKLKKKRREVEVQTNSMWSKVRTVLRNQGAHGINLFDLLLRSEFMLEEPWSAPGQGILWRPYQDQKKFLNVEDRKGRKGATRMSNESKRMSFRRSTTDKTSLTPSSTENGQLIAAAAEALASAGTKTVSDIRELELLTEEVLRQEDYALEEDKENQKLLKKVEKEIIDLERQRNFLLWLKEEYDSSEGRTEGQWRVVVEKKIMTKLREKGEAMQASKSEKIHHGAQW